MSGPMKRTYTQHQPAAECGERWWFWCEGCDTHHAYTTRLARGEVGPVWTMSGTPERPTFTPSLLCNRQLRAVCDCPAGEAACERDDHARPTGGYHRCHLFVTDGMVRYLTDCTHHLAGRAVPLQPPRF